MQYEKLNIPPGMVTVDTDYSSGPRWVDGDLVRFHKGRLQKLGGWTEPLTSGFQGTCRALHQWQPLASTDVLPYMAFGTHSNLELLRAEVFYDITPVRASGTLGNDPFAVTISSTTVTVTHSSHGIDRAGTFVRFGGATAGGGITIDGEYEVISIVDSNTYTITHTAAATSTDSTTGGAAVTYSYNINIGGSYTTVGLGWGAGAWNAAPAWNLPRVGWDGIVSKLGTWSLDSWGENLVAAPRGGRVYEWDASTGLSSNRAAVVTNSPSTNFILVSDASRQLIAFGSNQGSGSIDPMLVHWTDEENNTVWTSASTNKAGTFRLQHGGEIRSASRTRQQILIWTDTALYAMQHVPSFVFGFDLLGTNCGIVGPHARIEYNDAVYWMGPRNFYVYDGGVRVLDCPIHNHVFDDIEDIQRDGVFAGVNSEFGEIIFFYCSEDENTNDKYVIYNVEDKTWSFGTMSRTAWIDGGGVFNQQPLATNAETLYQHEDGVDAVDAAMTSYAETGEFELGSGDEVMFIDRLVPDLKDVAGNVDFIIKTRKYPAGTETSKSGLTASSSTTIINTRARGRQAALRVGSDAVADNWRLGTIRLRIQPDGER